MTKRIPYAIPKFKLKKNLKRDIKYTPRQKSIRALEIFRVQKLILNATS